jgi:hypothetical protein
MFGGVHPATKNHHLQPCLQVILSKTLDEDECSDAHKIAHVLTCFGMCQGLSILACRRCCAAAVL